MLNSPSSHSRWHLEAGLAATFLEAPLEVQQRIVPPSYVAEQCRAQCLPATGNAGGRNSTTGCRWAHSHSVWGDTLGGSVCLQGASCQLCWGWGRWCGIPFWVPRCRRKRRRRKKGEPEPMRRIRRGECGYGGSNDGAGHFVFKDTTTTCHNQFKRVINTYQIIICVGIQEEALRRIF